jgi:hypothetical protein
MREFNYTFDKFLIVNFPPIIDLAYLCIYTQYFTKVKRIPEIRGAERAYARSAPLISGFSQFFRDLLILNQGGNLPDCRSKYT